MQYFSISRTRFAHILQADFTGTKVPQFHWSNPEKYGQKRYMNLLIMITKPQTLQSCEYIMTYTVYLFFLAEKTLSTNVSLRPCGRGLRHMVRPYMWVPLPDGAWTWSLRQLSIWILRVPSIQYIRHPANSFSHSSWQGAKTRAQGKIFRREILGHLIYI